MEKTQEEKLIEALQKGFFAGIKLMQNLESNSMSLTSDLQKIGKKATLEIKLTDL